jgi:hypothetical protein
VSPLQIGQFLSYSILPKVSVLLAAQSRDKHSSLDYAAEAIAHRTLPAQWDAIWSYESFVSFVKKEASLARHFRGSMLEATHDIELGSDKVRNQC